MKVKKILALMVTGTMLMTMGGCNAITIDGEENVREGSSGNVIGFSVSTLNNPFFVTLTEGARKAATENNVELVVVDAGDDAAKQTSDIEDLVSRNVGVLIVNPVDSDAVAPAVKSAMSKGIKVIAVDRGVNGVDVDCQPGWQQSISWSLWAREPRWLSYRACQGPRPPLTEARASTRWQTNPFRLLPARPLISTVLRA